MSRVPIADAHPAPRDPALPGAPVVPGDAEVTEAPAPALPGAPATTGATALPGAPATFETIDEVVATFTPVARAIAAAVGPRCEVVVHDLSAAQVDLEHTVVAIENGHVSGRAIGGPSTSLGFDVLARDTEDHDAFGYRGATHDGRELRSSSVYLRNRAGRIIAALCINVDVSSLRAIQALVTSIEPSATVPTGAPGTGSEGADAGSELVGPDIGDVVEDMITRGIAETGKLASALTREDKVRVLRVLDEKGATSVGQAMPRIAARLGVSRSTAYQYLEEARRGA